MGITGASWVVFLVLILFNVNEGVLEMANYPNEVSDNRAPLCLFYTVRLVLILSYFLISIISRSWLDSLERNCIRRKIQIVQDSK